MEAVVVIKLNPVPGAVVVSLMGHIIWGVASYME